MAQSIADSSPSGEKPVSLEARPTADALSVERLMMELGQGRIRIPEFQRELSWDAEDARKLVDSVYRGYPVGTTILWKRPAGTARLTFGSLSIVASERHDALWVVDGQQRITSLARVLLPADPHADAFATFFDLDEAQFVSSRRARAAKDPDRYLPLTEVLDSVRLQLWVSGRKLDERRMKSAFRLGSRIREYSIPTYIVETPDEAALREMFGRLNSAGKPLTDDEVFNALHGVRNSDTARDLRDIAKELSRLEFGELEEPLVYKVLLAILGRDVVGADVPRLPEEEAARAFEDTSLALQAVIAFLKRDAGIPHESVIPYRQPLVALGKFFHLHPEPSARSRQLLTRWLWRGAWTASHAGDVASTRRVLSLISEDEGGTVQALLQATPKTQPDFSLDTFNFRHAQSKLEVLALVALRPRNLESGDELRLNEFSGVGWVPRLIDHESAAAGTVANRLIHVPISGLSTALRNVTDPEILASHGIQESAHEALLRGDSARFLAERTATLMPHIRTFLEAKARFGANDRPSLASLAVSDEEE